MTDPTLGRRELPKIGDVFELDYTFRDERTQVIKLIVVDVTDEHVMYKMPHVSINKIFPMTHEYWFMYQDERRPVATKAVEAVMKAEEE